VQDVYFYNDLLDTVTKFCVEALHNTTEEQTMGAYGDLKNRRRNDYVYILEYRTRWYDVCNQ
jgi:hypothetical protein